MFLKKKAVSVLSVLIEDVYLYLLGLVGTALWLMVGFGLALLSHGGGQGGKCLLLQDVEEHHHEGFARKGFGRTSWPRGCWQHPWGQTQFSCPVQRQLSLRSDKPKVLKLASS